MEVNKVFTKQKRPYCSPSDSSDNDILSDYIQHYGNSCSPSCNSIWLSYFLWCILFFFFDTKSQAPQPILIPSRHLTDAFDHASMVEDIW